MRKIALAVLVIGCTFAWAKDVSNPSDYTVNIHVAKSRNTGNHQELKVVINGRKYELERYGDLMLLALGDYKAKLVKDEHRGTYDSLQVYEFLLPDQKTVKFTVIGQAE